MIALAGVLLVVLVFGVFPHGRVIVAKMDRALHDQIIRYIGGPPEREDFVLLGIDVQIPRLGSDSVAGRPEIGLFEFVGKSRGQPVAYSRDVTRRRPASLVSAQRLIVTSPTTVVDDVAQQHRPGLGG